MTFSQDPKRLNEVARYLNKFAWRVQYSVFVGQFHENSIDAILRGLETIIDSRLDDVRCYPLPHKAEVALLGQQMFPPDILLVQDGINVLRLGAGLERQPDRSDDGLSEKSWIFS
ncbi:MAG: CRISPR-associated endonuclease Cas2 [Candidatus Competibacteraceae bacterium]|nr:CRISPR-associated endonuclease Cas2 [Candidatus Competibacteraceae bacterium]